MDIQSRLLEDYNKAIRETHKWYSDKTVDHKEAHALSLELYESRQEIVEYFDSLIARILEQERKLFSKQSQLNTCVNCRHEDLVYNAVPCLGCHGFDKWEVKE